MINKQPSFDPNVPIEFSSKVYYNEDESVITTYFIQTYVLLWKNYKIFSRKLSVLFYVILTPLIVGWMLWNMDSIGKILDSVVKLDHPIDEIGNVQHCEDGAIPTWVSY